MEWQEGCSSTAIVPIIPPNNEFTRNDIYIYDQWGNIPLYLPTPLKTNEEESGNPWIRVKQETERVRERFRPFAAGQEWSPLKLYSKSYSTYNNNDSCLSPSVYRSDFWLFFIGTKDGIVRSLKPYNLSKVKEDFKFSEEILDISTESHVNYMLVMTQTKLWQVFRPLREISQVGPVDDYLRIVKTELADMVVTKSGKIFELNLSDRKFSLNLIDKIASRVDNLVVVENLGVDARSGVLLAISNGNKVAILRLTRVGKDFNVSLIFQFRVYTEGSVVLETSDSQLFISAPNGWRDREPDLATLRAYSWVNLMQKRPSYEEIFLPGYQIVSITHKKYHLVVTMSYKTIIVYDTIACKRLYVITTPEQPVMAKFESNHFTYTSEDVFRVVKLPKTNKICSECLSVFDSPIINSHNSVSTIFVCKEFFS